MRVARANQRGFTMLELAVVIAIVGIIGAMAMVSLSGIKGRASFSSTTSEVLTAVRYVRATGLARGVPTAFILDTVNHRWWSLEKPAALTLDTFNAASPGTVISSGRLPQGVTFGPATGFGSALAAPFAGIPTQSGQSPNYLYCSFCRTSGTNQGFGMIEFQAGSSVVFNAGPSTIGQQFTLTASTDGVVRRTLIAIVARTGASQAIEAQ